MAQLPGLSVSRWDLYFADVNVAGTGIAMGSAPDAIKAAADMATDTVDDDGIANVLAKLFS